MKSVVCSSVVAFVFLCSCVDWNGATTTIPTITGSVSTAIISTNKSSSEHVSDTTSHEVVTTGTGLSTLTTSNGSTLETSAFTTPNMSLSTEPSKSIASETVTTQSSTMPTTPCPARSGFDAASFIGGIILGLSVLIILVIVVKCYQHHVNKSEQHYSQF